MALVKHVCLVKKLNALKLGKFCRLNLKLKKLLKVTSAAKLKAALLLASTTSKASYRVLW